MGLRSRLLVPACAGIVVAAGAAAQGAASSADSLAAPVPSIERRALSAPAPPESRRRPMTLGTRVGIARHSSFATRLGTPSHRDFYYLSIDASWPLAQSRTASVDYVLGFVPAAISTGNPTYTFVPNCTPTDACDPSYTVQTTRHTVFAVGLSPIGLRARLLRQLPVHLLLHGNVGVLQFSSKFPDPAATRFNFTAQAGAAVEVALPAHYELSVGYERHHTSNAGFGGVNPGLNANMLTVGVELLRPWR